MKSWVVLVLCACAWRVCVRGGPTRAAAKGLGHLAPSEMSARASITPARARPAMRRGQTQRWRGAVAVVAAVAVGSVTGDAARCDRGRREADEDREVIGGDGGQSDEGDEEHGVDRRDGRH